MAKAAYQGYKSFDYLDPGADYRTFEIAPQLERVPPSLVTLDDHGENEVERIVVAHPMISLHEHLGMFPADVAQTPDMVRTGRMPTAFEGLAASTWDCVFDNLMDGICTIHSPDGWQWQDVLHDLGIRLCDLAHQDFVVPCLRVQDILDAKQMGRVAWVASMEGAAMIENELDRIEILYGFGVRALGITYSEANALGSGLKEPGDGGLTRFGIRAVERMNKVGMLIDCSHCGDQTTLDTIRYSEQPIVLSHIGARALWESNRLAPDEVLTACAAKGGVIGIECAPHTTVSAANPKHSLASFMDHFEYIKDLVGIDHVAFGPDTLYGDHVGLHEVYAANLSIKDSRARSAAPQGSDAGPGASAGSPVGVPPSPDTVPGYEKVRWVEGLENPTEGSHNLVRWLVKEGYSEEDVAKVMGGNVLRLLETVWV